MKKFGLWLLKNNIHIMTAIFLGWAVWAICYWNSLVLVQKLVLGLYAWLILHEYEEGYKGRFLDLMLGRVMGIGESPCDTVADTRNPLHAKSA